MKLNPTIGSELITFYRSSQLYLQKTITSLTKWTQRESQNRGEGLPSKGKVFLVGAGCGDPELLTLKAHRLLQQADVIMVDWLVNPEIYPYFAKHAERIFVGKKCGHHSMKQSDICKLMVAQAQQGKTVVRLKGGDPSVFGRLGEETAILTEHNIPFAIVPGVTAASGCAAYSGIPLTDRDCAQSVKFVTAHLKSANDEVDWQSIANGHDTLVFYMGLNRVDKIANRLMEHGVRGDMPIAIIDQGTSHEQQVVTSTISTINSAHDLAALKGPALIVVGEVVNKRQEVDLSLLYQQNSEQYAALSI